MATLIFSGVLDECPNLRVCIAHGGGGACFGMGRLDHGWQVRSEARVNIRKPPSAYQKQIYYDFLTSSEAGLRFLIDSVGIDRVVIGSDWPFVGWDPSPGGWLESLSLTREEKEKISWSLTREFDRYCQRSADCHKTVNQGAICLLVEMGLLVIQTQDAAFARRRFVIEKVLDLGASVRGCWRI